MARRVSLFITCFSPSSGARPFPVKNTKTGHPAVDATDQLFEYMTKANLTLGLFPDNWLKKITTLPPKGKRTTRTHQPDWSACWVLGKICYFYRSGSRIVDGQMVRQKKFASDLWNLCVTELAEQCDLTPRAVRYILDRLEQHGLIKCHKRFEGPTGRKGTYLYIELFVDKVAKITFLKPDHGKYISPAQEADFPTPGNGLHHHRKPVSYQSLDSGKKTPKEKTNKQKEFVRSRPSDSSQGASAPRTPAPTNSKPEPQAKAEGKLMEFDRQITAKQAELDRLKEEHHRLLMSDYESDEDYLRNESQRKKVNERMSDLRSEIVDLKSALKAAREDEEEEARQQEMLTPEFQAGELAKVVEYAPKLHQAHFGEPLPQYDRSKVAAVLAQLSDEGWYQPAMQFIGRLALAWRRI